MRVTYFINQYPKVSHSFIRREIIALERLGVEVQRIALRGLNDQLVDAEDVNERTKTAYILESGVLPLIGAVLKLFITTPLRFLSALKLAIKMGWRADRPLPFHFIYFAEACKLLENLRTFNSQHVHAHFGSNSAEVVMLAYALGGPSYSFTVHGPEEFDKPHALKLADKVKQAAFVVAISSFGRSQLCRLMAYKDWHKIKVVHCGIEKSFYAMNEAPQALPKTTRLVCVGRLCEQKGQLLLLEACKNIKEKGFTFELVLAGDGEMRPQVEQFIKIHGLEYEVRVTGWISGKQVREEILAAHAMVLPSFAEGLPVVIMEAMSLKRPVISTYVAGIPELVIPNENGWLIPAGSVDALTTAVEQLISTPQEKLIQMGNLAHERVVQRHDIDTEAAKLYQLFNGSVNK